MADQDVAAFNAARDFLLANADDYEAAYAGFQWPALTEFNWALDHFDAIARGNDTPALWIVEEDGSERRWSFAEMSDRSDRVASWLRSRGVARGDRLILMLGNQVELWETILAAMKLGAILIPATPLLGPADLRDRLERGNARHVVVGSASTDKFADVAGDYTRIAVGVRCGRLAAVRRRLRRGRRVPARRRHPRRRHAAALLHLRHHGAPEARRAHARVVPGRASVHDVLDRPAPGRRTPQHLLARLGQARLEQRLRAVERRRVRVHLQLHPLRRRRAAGPHGPLRRHELLRAADRLADDGAVRPVAAHEAAAQRGRRRRTAQPGGHRAGPGRVGHHDPRRFRPDRDDRPGGQPARAEGQAGLDGPGDAGIRGRAARPGQRRGRRRGRDLPQPVAAARSG